MAVLRLPVVGLTALLSMVVLGALVVAFEAFGVATFRGAHGDVRKQHEITLAWTFMEAS